MSDDTPKKHHEIRATDPLFRPTPRGGPPVQLAGTLSSVERMRELAVASIARDEECSLEEAALRLDTTPAPKSETPEQIAARRHEAEHARVEKELGPDGLALPVDGKLLPLLVRGAYERTRAVHEAAAWLRGPRRVLVLIGDIGVGKTVAASLVACSYARRRKTVAYLREPTLARWWHSSVLAHEAQIERLRETDLVIVDELGTTLSRDGEKARDATGGLVDDRIAGEGRTVLIGNLDEKRLGTAYGARFLDRLREIGTVVHLTGASMRGRS